MQKRWPFFGLVVGLGIFFGLVVDWKGYPLTGDGASDVLATVLVGWWLQHALQRDADLERIPLSGVARAAERIESLVNSSIDRGTQTPLSSDPQLLTTLRLLHNEVAWLEEQARKLGIGDKDYREVFNTYVAVKGHLTRGPTPDVRLAADEARSMRTHCAELHWRIAQQILVKGKALKLFER